MSVLRYLVEEQRPRQLCPTLDFVLRVSFDFQPARPTNHGVGKSVVAERNLSGLDLAVPVVLDCAADGF